VTPRDDAAFAALVHTWEPAIEVDRTGPVGRLYDPDATVYAVCLGPACTLRTERRGVAIRPADLVILPPGLALEVAPDANFLAVRHLGAPPYHFRERFIQVWGFEHFAPTGGAGATAAVLDPAGTSHRIDYRTQRLQDLPAEFPATNSAMTLVFAIRGHATLDAGSGRVGMAAPGCLALVPPGESFTLVGQGLVGIVGVEPELVHEARVRALLAAPRPLSPENPSGIPPRG
jgi:hypothetical protein